VSQALFDPGEPEAEITRPGRWVYQIRIIEGITACGTWHAFSRSRAEGKARKKLAWYRRRFGPPREQWTVR
jgi:hypothetical protein